MNVSNKFTVLILLVLTIASCSPKSSNSIGATNAKDYSLASQAASEFDIPMDYASCTFNGQNYNHNEGITAFQNSSVAYGSSCISEQRVCNNGTFSGSYQYSSCNVDQPASCLYNGQTIASGQSLQSFQNSNVAYGSSCVSEQRTCTNGVLSGSFQYSSCNVGQAASCLFDGQTITSGQTINAFPNSTVGYGQTCQSETRTCNNGILSGSNQYSSCNVDQAASCLFNGQTLAHGQNVTGFQNSTVSFGGSCVSEQRTCDNGILTGSFQYSSCNVGQAASCLFNGQTVAHGQSVNAFPSSSVPYDDMCISESRTCNNGVLSGSNQFGTCQVARPASCLFNGQTIAHGQTVNGFLASTANFGDTCQVEERECNNGELSGTNQYSSCTVNQPASCLINGQTIANGQNITLFESSSVAFGETCISQQRTCANGTLSGSFESASCVVEAAPPVEEPPVDTPPATEEPPVVTPPVSTTPPVVTPPVSSTPPVVVTPPVSTTPPVVTPPVVTPPIVTPPVITPPASSTPPVVIPPTEECDDGKDKHHSDNGNHYGWYKKEGGHSDNGNHYGWYKHKKPCKPKPEKEKEKHPCKDKKDKHPCKEHKDNNNKEKDKHPCNDKKEKEQKQPCKESKDHKENHKDPKKPCQKK